MAGLTKVKIGGLHGDCIDGTKVADDSINSEHINHSAALPNGVTATTQSSGDNSTKVATTAYVDAATGALSSDSITEGNTTVEVVDTGSDGHITFDTEGSERMRITSDGNVGIGTASPSANLHIDYQSNNPAIFTIENNEGSFKLSANANLGLLDAAQHVFRNAAGSSEYARIDSSGRVGIGVTDNSVYSGSSDNLVIKDGGSAGITLHSGTGSTGCIRFADGTSSNAEKLDAAIEYNHLSGDLTIRTDDTARLTIDDSGDIQINDGNLVLASGHGIDFSATANSSGTMSSELLDDYEEGTWTPSAGGNTTYTTQNGRYTKIGRLVTVFFHYNIDTLGTGSNFKIEGLPFNASGSGSVRGEGHGSIGIATGLSTSVVSCVPYVADNTNSIFVITRASAAASTSINTAIYTDDTRVEGTVTYETVS